MKTYRVALTRTYIVTIKAASEEKAKRYSEFFLGHSPDASTEKERSEFNFSFEDIEMVENDAFEILDPED